MAYVKEEIRKMNEEYRVGRYETIDELDTYYEKPNFDYQHILRFMDLFGEHYDDYLA